MKFPLKFTSGKRDKHPSLESVDSMKQYLANRLTVFLFIIVFLLSCTLFIPLATVFAAQFSFFTSKLAQNVPVPGIAPTNRPEDAGQVLAEYDPNNPVYRISPRINFNIPTNFDKDVYIQGSLLVQGRAVIPDGIEAPNVIYNVIAGQGVEITGDQELTLVNAGVLSIQGQTGDITFEEGNGIQVDGTTITNTGVTSLQGQTGAVTLTAGSGISISGTTISSTVSAASTPSFVDIEVAGQDTLTASGQDSLTIAAGSGISLTTDDATQTLTITAAVSSDAGFTDDGGIVRLTTVTDSVGIGTASPSTKLHVVGSTRLEGDVTVTGNLTFSNLTDGVVRSTSGVLSTGDVVLGTETSGNYVSSLSAGNGIAVSGVAGEGWTPTAALGNLSADWTQNGDFDIVLNSSSSELRILESGASPQYYVTVDVADLNSDKLYTFPNISASSATVCLSTGNCAGSGAGIGGSGTTNRVAKWFGAFEVGDGSIDDLYTGLAMTISASGNVGIGTSSPDYDLTVAGDVKVGDGSTLMLGQAAADPNPASVPDGALYYNSSSQRFRCKEAGSWKFCDTSVSGGSISGSGTTNGVTYFDSTSTITSATGFVFDPGTTRLGIGTSSPATTLDIGGTARIQNQGEFRFADADSSNYVAVRAPSVIGTNFTLTLPTTAGNANEMLTTDGSGNLSWTAAGDITAVGDVSSGAAFDGTQGNVLQFEGSTADGNEISLTATDPDADRTITLPNLTGTVALLEGTQTFSGAKTFSGGLTASGAFTASSTITLTGEIQGASPLILEGSTADGNETTIAVTDPSADRTITIPNASGTVAVSASGPIALSAAGDISCTTCLTTTSNLFTLAGTSGSNQTISTGDTVTIAAGTGISTTGGATDTVTITNTGVTSLAGTTNQVSVSASTGSVTLSLPQNINTDANVNFNTLTLDAQAGLTLNPFGTSAGNTSEIRLSELVANGSSYTGFKAPDSLASSLIYTLPDVDGSDNYVLTTNGSGVLAWESVTGAGGGSITAVGDVSSGAAFNGTQGNVLQFEGTTADTNEISLTVADPDADRTITLPNLTGTVALLEGTQTFSGAKTFSGGLTASGAFTASSNITLSGEIQGASPLILEGSTSDTNELTLAVTDPSADRTITFPNASGTVAVSASGPIALSAAGDISCTTCVTTSTTLFTLAGTSGSNQTIVAGDTVTIAAGTGISTSGGATDTVTITNTGVTQLTGTANQVSVSASTGSVTLSLPQNIHTDANVNFNTLTLDAQAGLTLNPYGTSAGNTSEIRLSELVANGSSYTGFKAPDSLAGNVIYTLPDADGSDNYVLTTNGSGVLAWESVSGIGAGGDITAVGDVSSGAAFDGTQGNVLQFEGSTADGNEISLTAADPDADRTITLPNLTGTVALLEGTQTFSGAKTFSGGLTASGAFTASSNITLTGEIQGASAFILEGSTGDTNELTLALTDPSADRTITFPNASGTVAVSASGPIALSAAGDISCTTCLTTSTTLFTLAGTSGSNQTIVAGDTVTIAAGTGISTTGGATDTVTITNTGVTQLTGTANQVSVSASTGSVTLSLPQNIHTDANVNFNTLTLDAQAGLILNPYGTSTGNTAEIRFSELVANGSNYTGFKAPDSLAGNVIYTLPETDGSPNYILTTSGSGVLSWSDSSSLAAGDITAVGDVSSGAAFDGTQGNVLQFEGSTADGNEISLTAADADADRTITLPNLTGTVALLEGTQTFSGAKTFSGGLTASGAFTASSTITLSGEIQGASPLILEGSSADNNELTLAVTDPSADRTITFPNASGTVAVSASGPIALSAAGDISCTTCLTTSSNLFTLAGSSGSSQTIAVGDTVTIAAGTGISTSGGATDTVTITNTGVTQLTGTANQVTVSASTGSVTLSLPQNINTDANVNFNTLTLDAQAGLTLNPYGTSAGNTSEIRFSELVANGSSYTGFKAPDNLASNLIYTLPSVDGSPNYVLTTSGSGTLTWSDAASIGGDITAVGDVSSGAAFDGTQGNVLQFEGATTDTNEISLTAADADADRTITLPNLTGTVALLEGTQTFSGAKTFSGGLTASGAFTASSTITLSGEIQGASPLILEGSSGDNNELTIAVTDPSADRTITFPNASGTVAVSASGPIALSAAGDISCTTCLTTSTTLFTLAGTSGSNQTITSGDTVTIAAGTGISTSGGATDTVTITNTGVTQLTGTANQVSVSASTGSITLSLPQNIHTDATVNFNTLTLDAQAGLTLNPFGTSAGNTSEVRFSELVANGSSYTGFKAPDSLASNLIYTLPSVDGSPNYVLTTSGSGVLAWADASAVGGDITAVGDVSSGAAFDGTQGNNLQFEGTTADTNEITLTAADATADRTITLPNLTGTVALLEGTQTFSGAKTFSGGLTASGAFTASSDITLTGEIQGASPLVLEGITADGNETTIAVADPTADRTITIPNLTGTLALLENAQTFSGAKTFSATLTADGDFVVNGNTTIGNATSDTLGITATITGASPLTFEGSTADNNETTFAVTDPDADRTITFPNASGTVAVSASGPIALSAAGDISCTTCLTTSSNLFTLAGSSGASQTISTGDTVTIAAGTGISTSAGATDTVTITNTGVTQLTGTTNQVSVSASTGSVTLSLPQNINTTANVNFGSVTTSGQGGIVLTAFGTSAGETGELRFRELTANGTSFVGLKAPDTLAADTVYTLPSAFGLGGQVLSTSASGVLSWVDQATGTISGSGTTNTIPRFTSATAIGDSALTDNGSLIGIGRDISFSATTPSIAIANSETLSVTDGTNTLLSLADAGTIGNLTTGGVYLNPFGTSAGNTSEIRFGELVANGSSYTGFKAPDSLAGSVIYTLPSADGSNNYVLTTSGSGVLSWQSVTGAGGGQVNTVGSMAQSSVFADSSADDDWLGLGAAAGRIEFDDQSTDEVNILDAFLGLGTTAPTTRLDVNGNIRVQSQGEVRLADSDSSNYTGFKAPGTIAADVIYTLPNADGSDNYVLTTNGSGVLAWESVTGAGGGSITAVGDVNSGAAFNGTQGNILQFEGSTADGNEISLTAADPDADRTITLPNLTGTIALLEGTQTFSGAKTFSGGLIASGAFTASSDITLTGEIQGASPLILEGSTADGNETTIAITDPTADRTITIPNLTGTLALLENAQTFSGAKTFSATLTADGDFVVNGNTTIGNAAGDTLGITATITGGSPFTFEGATGDNNETTFAITDPDADRTITFPNASGTVAVSASGPIALSAAGDISCTTCVTTSTTLFTLAGTSGSNQTITSGDTVTIAAGTGISTSGGATDTVTITNTGVTSLAGTTNQVSVSASTGSVTLSLPQNINTTANVNFASVTTSASGGLVLTAFGTSAGETGELRFRELTANGTNYVGFKSPDNLSGNTIYTLPSADGSTNYVLTTSGSGVLSWQSTSGIGGIVGSGTTNAIPRFTAANSIGDSAITDNGSIIGIGRDISFTATTPSISITDGETFLITDGTNTLMSLADQGSNANLTVSGDLAISGGNITTAVTFDSTATVTGTLTGNGNVTLGDAAGDLVTINGTIQGASPLVFEGDTADNNELTLAVTDPSADRTITFPNASGTVAVSASGPIALSAAGDISCTTCLTTSSNLFTLAGTSGSSQTISTGDTVTIAAGTGISTTGGATDTVTITNTGVTSIAGTTNQVSVSASTGSVTLSLPQNINTDANVNFNTLTLDAQAGLTLNPYGTSAGNTSEIRFSELVANGSSYTGFKAPDSLAGSVIYTLPGADGSPNYVLTTSGSGVLSWSDASALSAGDISAVGDVSSGAAFDGTQGNVLQFEGSTADGNEISLTAADPDADRTITLPNLTGTVALLEGTQTFSGAKTFSGGLTASGAFTASSDITLSGEIQGASPLILEGATANTNELTLAVTDPSADRTITFPNASGTVAVSASGPIALSAAGDISCTTCLTTSTTLFTLAGTSGSNQTITSGDTVTIAAGTGISTSGGATDTVTITNTGVTQLTGTANQVTVSASTGSVTLSLPQNINTDANVNFNTLTLDAQAGLTLNPYGTSAGNTSEIRFSELVANGSSYTGFKAPDSLAGTVIYTLPDADGSPSYVLTTSGSGVLSWADSAAVGGAITAVGDVSSGDAFTGVQGNVLYFEGSSADGNEIALTAADPDADRTITLPNLTGTVALLEGTQTFSGAKTFSGGLTASGALTASSDITLSGEIQGASPLILEGATANTNELTLAVTDPSADRTITFPNASGTVAVSASAPIALSAAGDISCITCLTTSTTLFTLAGTSGSNQTITSGDTVTIAAGTGISTSGGATDTVTITNTGVTSIAGTTNQVSVSASTGGVTLSLPQNIHTDATVNFNTVTLDAQAGLTLNPYGTSAGNTSEVRFSELVANGSSYTGFKAPDSLAGTVIYTLPDADGLDNYVLTTSGSGVLAWESTAGIGAGGDITAVGDVSSGAAFDGTQGNVLQFEGSSADANEISLTAADPDADRTITLPNLTGTIALLEGTQTFSGAKTFSGGLTASGAFTASSDITLTGEIQGASPFILEGATANTNELTLAVTDPSADRTITFPNASGTVAVSASGPIALSAAGDISCSTCLTTSTTLFTLAGTSGSNQTITSGDTVTIAAGTGISTSGGATDTVTITNTGVTSLAGTTNQISVSASTGSVTLSLPQNIHTDATVNFNTLTLDAQAGLTLNPFGTSAGNTSEVRFSELVANGSSYTGFKAPDSLAGSVIYTLPDADGLDNYVLTTSGSGVLAWESTAGIGAGGDITAVGDVSSGAAFDGTQGNILQFEGSSADANEISLTAADPDADRTITLPNLTGTVALLEGTQTFSGAKTFSGGLTASGALTASSDITLTGEIQGASPFILEGATANTNELTLAVTDPSADRTITFPNASGTVAVSATAPIALSAAGDISCTTCLTTSTTLFTLAGTSGSNQTITSGDTVTIAAGTGISTSGGATDTVTITNTGVTSLAGTTNQISVSASTGSVTLSLPQNIHTDATVNFNTLTLDAQAGLTLNPFGTSAGNTSEVRFSELVANGSSYTGFKAPDSLAGSVIYTLPDADGLDNYVLTTSGSGVLAWESTTGIGAGGDITAVGSMTSGAVFADSGAADDWLGLGAAAGRIHFTDSTNDVVSIMGGRFGVGTTSGAAIADILGTTEQLRLSYDASNYASFTTSASGDLTIAPSGNDLGLYSEVGIGTSNPTRVLDIVTANNTENMLALTNTSGNVISFFQPNDTSGVVQFNFGTSGNTDRGRIRYQNSDDSLQLTTNDTTWLHLSSTGFVGLGTTAPSEKLNVLGAIITTLASATDNQSGGLVGAANDDFLVGSNYINTYGFGFENPGSGLKAYMSGYYGLDFYTNNNTTPRLSVSNTGTVTVANNLEISNQGDLRLLESGSTNYFGLQAAASMDSDDVYTWPADMPAGSNYALTSNSAGTLTWYDLATLGGGADITAVGSMTSGAAFADSGAADDWLGLGAAAGRIHFTDSTNDVVSIMGGRFGVGTTSGAAIADILGTTEQLRLSYDASNYASFTTSASGDLTLAPSGGDTNLTGTLDVSSNAALGSTGTVATTSVLGIANTFTATAGTNYNGLNNAITLTPSSSAAAGYNGYGINNTLVSSSANNSDYNSLNGIASSVTHAGTGTATIATGGNFVVTNASSGVISTAYGLSASVINTSSSAITNAYGMSINNTGVGATGGITNLYNIHVDSAADTGSGSITTNYGLHIAAQTAATSDYGARIDAADTQTLWLSGNADNTSAAAGIAFGSSRDTNLYRGAANTLQTDDTFVVNGGNIVVNNAGEIRLAETGSVNYTGFKSPGTLAGNYVYTLPTDFGTDNYVLTTDGTGTLAWENVNTFGGDITAVGSMTSGATFADSSAADDWLGLGAAAGRIHFTDSTNDVVSVMSGRFGVGTTSGAAIADILGTTEQLRLSYDASNYASFTTSASGDLTIAPSGADTSITGTLGVSALTSLNGGSSTTRTISANSGTVSVADITLTTPAHSSGTNVNNGISFAPTIGNATAGTNTANVINIDALTGDAEVTLRGINIGALTGTGATENAINIGSGWDAAFVVNGTTIVNGSAQVPTTVLNGTLFTSAGDSGSQAIVQGNTLTLAGGTNITSVQSGTTLTMNLDNTISLSGDLTVQGGNVDFDNAVDLDIDDNLASSFTLSEGANNYLAISTSNTTESMSFGNATTNPSFSFLGSGLTTLGGDLTITGNDLNFGNGESLSNATDGRIAMSASSILVLGSHSGDPSGTNGATYYNTSTHRMRCYLNGAWTDCDGSGSGSIAAVGSMTSTNVFADTTADDDWLGLGATNGRIEFDDQATDEVNILNANVGIGTATPSTLLHLVGTTEQLRVGYDGSNYLSTTVGSTGGVTLNATGSGAAFTFSDNVTVSTGNLLLGVNETTNALITFYSSGASETDPSIGSESDGDLTLLAPSGIINIGSGSGDIELDPGASNLRANLTGVGDFQIEDNGTPFFTFTDSGTATFAFTGTTTTGLATTANSLTTGTVLDITSTATSLSSGKFLNIAQTGASGSTAFTGDIAKINYTQTFNGGVGLSSTGNVADIGRAITLNNSGNTHTVSGALLNITDSFSQSAGTLTVSANSQLITRTCGTSVTCSGAMLALVGDGAGTDTSGISITKSSGTMTTGLVIGSGTQTITNGINLDSTGITTDIILQNDESIDNNTDGLINFTGRGFFTTDLASGQALTLFNDGNNVNREGLAIQAGPDNATGTWNYIVLRDGDGTDDAYIQSASGTVTIVNASDSRLKNSIVDTKWGLEDLMKIQVRDYNLNENNTHHTGFIAQELAEAYKPAVYIPDNPNDYWGVSFEMLTPLLVQSIQDQQNMINSISVAQATNATQSEVSTYQNTVNQKISKLEQDVATISAQLAQLQTQSQSATVANVASIEAKLLDHATRIETLESKTLAMEEQLASISARLTDSVLGANTASGSANLATSSATLDSLIVSDKTNLNDLGVTGMITAGMLTIEGFDTMGEAAINTLGGPLKLQSLGLESIEMVGGKVTIDPDGNITTTGTVAAKKVTTEKISIDTTVQEQATAGKAVIKAGRTSITIPTASVTPGSLVFVTATTKIAETLSVTEQLDGVSFTVELPKVLTEDVSFNWFIVEQVVQ